MKKTQLKASNLRTTMFVMLFLLITLLIGGFYFVQGWLNDYAINSNSSSQTVDQSDPQAIKQLETEISNQKIPSGKAINMIASKQNYQTQIRQDLDKYASDTNVTISQYGTTNSPTNTTNIPLINGVQSNFISVTIKNPVPFTNLIKFIKAIESNLPKLKLMSLNLTRSGDSGDTVNVEPLIIEVYTR